MILNRFYYKTFDFKAWCLRISFCRALRCKRVTLVQMGVMICSKTFQGTVVNYICVSTIDRIINITSFSISSTSVTKSSLQNHQLQLNHNFLENTSIMGETNLMFGTRPIFVNFVLLKQSTLAKNLQLSANDQCTPDQM